MTESNLKNSIAWQQFLIARKAILDEYDQAVTHSMPLAVHTHHGVVAEAAIRDWLGTFLPDTLTQFGSYDRGDASS